MSKTFKTLKDLEKKDNPDTLVQCMSMGFICEKCGHGIKLHVDTYRLTEEEQREADEQMQKRIDAYKRKKENLK